MKILFLIDNLGSGGAQNQISLLAKELVQLGHKITMVTYYPQDFYSERIKLQGIERVRLQKKDRLGIKIPVVLAKLIRQDQYDVALSFLNTPNIYLFLAQKLSFKKLPFIVSYRSQTEIKFLSFLSRWLKNLCNNSASYIVTNSHHERKTWITYRSSLKNKIHTIYNAVDFKKFHFEDYRSRNSPLKLLCVGSISQDKNGRVLIEAMDELVNKLNLDVHLTWVGKKVRSIKSRREYIDMMENLIDDYNLGDSWEWREPTVSIEKLYNKFHALVLCSTREGLPNVVCEALSCGMPVLLSNVLDHPILADFGNNGLLFDPNDNKSLAEMISKLYYETDETYLRYQKNALQFAESNFNIERFISSYLKIFDAISNETQVN